MLVEAGYDVWLGNYRGNTYTRNQTYLNPDEGKKGFWDFTWDEMAKYDIPTAYPWDEMAKYDIPTHGTKWKNMIFLPMGRNGKI